MPFFTDICRVSDGALLASFARWGRYYYRLDDGTEFVGAGLMSQSDAKFGLPMNAKNELLD